MTSGDKKSMARKRLGTWERIQRTAQVEGIGEVPVVIVRVTYEGHIWEVSDTKEGRAKATVNIHAIQERQAAIIRVERSMQMISELALFGDKEDALRKTVIAAMEDLKTRMGKIEAW